jgi:hypothetical protein
MFCETADSPKGADGEPESDQSASGSRAVPKSQNTKPEGLPAVTMEEVASAQNLTNAFKKVASNKGAPGADRQGIAEVREHLDEILPALRRELLNGSYRPGSIRRVWIPKSGGGQRGLGIPNVVDRVVQQAVYNVLGPLYEPTFHKSSHGFRPERSCHTAIYEAKRHLGGGHEWLVDLDLERFFDKVNHQRLLARLEQKVSDQRLLRLIHLMLKAGVVMPDGVVVSTDEGVPKGVRGLRAAYVKKKAVVCFTTADFLSQGTAAEGRDLSEFVDSDGTILAWPEGLVFQDAPSTLIVPGGGEAEW